MVLGLIDFLRRIYRMMTYKDLKDLEEFFPHLYSIHNLSDIKLLLIGDFEQKRMVACERTKKVLEDLLEAAQREGEIKGFCIPIIDLSKIRSMELAHDFNKEGKVSIPIFHNADGHPHLPQQAFDRKIPGVFSFSREGYFSILNSSKRDCYDRIYL